MGIFGNHDPTEYMSPQEKEDYKNSCAQMHVVRAVESGNAGMEQKLDKLISLMTKLIVLLERKQ